jgi:hypothetical protein
MDDFVDVSEVIIISFVFVSEGIVLLWRERINATAHEYLSCARGRAVGFLLLAHRNHRDDDARQALCSGVSSTPPFRFRPSGGGVHLRSY